MTSIVLHPSPRWFEVVREQFRTVGLALRREGMFFVGLLAVFAALAIQNAIRTASNPHAHGNLAYGPGAAIPMALAGMLIAIGVWREESPARRAYHWVMPVARTPHALARILSGWVWLMLATLVYVLYLAALSAVVSAIQGPPYIVRWVPAWWHWAVPFTATTVAYLFGSAAVVGSNHPMRWIVGLWAAYFILPELLEEIGMPAAGRVQTSIARGRYGLAVVAAGDGRGAEQWLLATLLWGAIGAVLLWIALYRRPEG